MRALDCALTTCGETIFVFVSSVVILFFVHVGHVVSEHAGCVETQVQRSSTITDYSTMVCCDERNHVNVPVR